MVMTNENESTNYLKPMLKRKILRPVAKVPLADQFTPVSHRGQYLGYQHLLVLDTSHYLLGRVGVPARVSGLVEPGPQGQSSCQQRCSGRRADGCTGVELRK